MLDVTRRRRYPRKMNDLPDWIRELEGFDHVAGALPDADLGGHAGDAWQVSMTLPKDLSAAVEDTDPVVILVMLAYGLARFEDKIAEAVDLCRESGKSWTQIGEALGTSKQAAWERFSGED